MVTYKMYITNLKLMSCWKISESEPIPAEAATGGVL